MFLQKYNMVNSCPAPTGRLNQASGLGAEYTIVFMKHYFS